MYIWPNSLLSRPFKSGLGGARGKIRKHKVFQSFSCPSVHPGWSGGASPWWWFGGPGGGCGGPGGGGGGPGGVFFQS